MSERSGPETESERPRAPPSSDDPTPAQAQARAGHQRTHQEQSEERAAGVASALATWAQQQSPMGGFNAYYNRLVRHLDDGGDVLAALEKAHREALREVPTLSDSINMASYAAASFVEGYLAAHGES